MKPQTGLQSIPGVGKQVAEDLRHLGIHAISDLKNKHPQVLYEQLCAYQHEQVDRCMLYTFRCAVYYASHTSHDPAKLKWWNWMDKEEHGKK